MRHDPSFALIPLSRHAQRRARQRAIPIDGIKAALDYGTEHRRRGALFTIVDGRAVERARREGIDLSEVRGLVLVCSSIGDEVLTTYWRE